MWEGESRVESETVEHPIESDYIRRAQGLAALRVILYRLNQRRLELLEEPTWLASRLRRVETGESGIRVDSVSKYARTDSKGIWIFNAQSFFHDTHTELLAFLRGPGPLDNALDRVLNPQRPRSVQTVFYSRDGSSVLESDLGGLATLDARPHDQRLLERLQLTTE